MPFPTVRACLICDQVRPELGNKFILLGYYGLAPVVSIVIVDFSQPITLCFVFAGGAGHGHFRIGVRVTAPNGTAFDGSSVDGDLREGVPGSNFFMSFHGVLPGPGDYRVDLLVDGVSNFRTAFALTRPPVPNPPN